MCILRISVLLLLALTGLQAQTIVWTKYTMPVGCSDSAAPPCYWPTGQGFASIVPDPVNGGAFIYTTRQQSTGTVTVTGGIAVAWTAGDKFGPAWGLAAGDQIIINGVTKTIVQGSVTATALTLTSTATNGTFAYSVNNTLTFSSDVYNYFPSTHTFSGPYAGGNGTIANLSGNLETDSHTGSWPADRQQLAHEFYDSSRNAVWLTGGVNGGKSWNCSTNGTVNCNPAQFEQTTWRINLATKIWTGIASAHHPINSSIAQASAIDTNHQVIVQGGSDGGPGFRTSIFCPTDLNPTPGTLTANQTTAGCVTADDWVATVATTGAAMPNLNSPAMVYSPTAQKIVLYGGAAATPNSNFYTYTPLTKTWTKIIDASCSAVTMVVVGSNPALPGLAVLPSGSVLYHQYGVNAAAAKDWIFDPVAGTCAQVTIGGTGAAPSQADGGAWGTMLTFDAATSKAVAYPQTSAGYIWEGVLHQATALSVPLEVREALYVGDQTGKTSSLAGGVARTNEPFCQGIPIPDSAAVTSTDFLNVTGASAGQFRTLGVWPSGNVKFVKVCGIVPTLSAGGTATVTLTNNGAGNFGGSNLATDSGATITIVTGTSTFTVKKANFNVIDTATVNGTALISTSTAQTRGLVLYGPNPTAAFPGNVTCLPAAGGTDCSQTGAGTLYSSANDPNSSCSIEENGPVMSVLKCIGNYVDNASHAYMHHTTRLYFYNGKNNVKVRVVRRNADYNVSAVPSPDFSGNNFNTAAKGVESDELRLDTSITGTLNYSVATSTTPQTGTITAAPDSVYIYEAQLDAMTLQSANGCTFNGAACANLFTPDLGYSVVKTVSGTPTTLQSGLFSAYPKGYADIADAAGNGIEIGVYQMAGYWPKSLELYGDGSVRVGIFPQQNSIPTYQAWTSWSIPIDIFLSFHTSTPASLPNDFLKQQHYLVARPSSLAYINSTNVLPYPLVDPAYEDSYYATTSAGATPPLPQSLCQPSACTTPALPDRFVGVAFGNNANNLAREISVPRFDVWSTSGTLHQEEFRRDDLARFWQRGMTGGYINSMHRYLWQGSYVWPHEDGTATSALHNDSRENAFQWRNRPHANAPNAELKNLGLPAFALDGNSGSVSTNSAKALTDWVFNETLHTHIDGQSLAYMITGDETLRDSMVPWKDYYMNPDTFIGQNGYPNTGSRSGAIITNTSTTPFDLTMVNKFFMANGIRCGTVGSFQNANQITLQAGNTCPAGNIIWQVSYLAIGLINIERAQGIVMRGATNFAEYLQSIGDSEWPTALNTAKTAFLLTVKPDTCVNGFPAGCTMPPTYGNGTGDPIGVSKIRGAPAGSRGQDLCPAALTGNNYMRIRQPFEDALLSEGLLSLWRGLNLMDPAWPDKNLVLDNAYGISSSAINEGFYDDGTARWQGDDTRYNGFRFEVPLDIQDTCSFSLPGGTATVNGNTATIVSSNVGPVDASWVNGTGVNTSYRHFSINGFDQSITGVNVGAQTVTLNLPLGAVGSGGATKNFPVATRFQLDGPGTATNVGAAVTWASGLQFPIDGSWAPICPTTTTTGMPFGWQETGSYRVSCITDATHLTLSLPLPDHATPRGYRIGGYNGDPVYTFADGSTWDSQTLSSGGQMVWNNFYIQWLVNGVFQPSVARKFDIAVMKALPGATPFPIDLGGQQIGMVLAAKVTPGSFALQDIPFTRVDNGGGSYTLAFTPPAGSTALRIKWSPKIIANSGGLSNITANGGDGLLGYDTRTQTYTLDPNIYATWFGANAITEPPPTPGVSQSVSISTGTTGLTVPNFSVKAMAPTGPLAITPAALPATTLGSTTYSQSLAAQVSGGAPPYGTYVIASGALPTGLTLNSSTGLISGTVSGTTGVKTFTWSVTDTAPTTVTSASETITVNAAPSISTSSPLTAATYGVSFSQTLVATGGTTPYTWSTGAGLPTGVTLSSSGVVSGTPTTGGQGFSFTATVTDAAGVSGNKVFAINVNPLYTYGNASITPTNCSHTNAVYAPLDLNTCTLPGEVPLGTFTIPAVGSSYNDANFGTPVTVLSRNDLQGPSVTAYPNPAAWSATGQYVGIAVNTNTTILNPTNGTVIRGNSSSPPAPGFVTDHTLLWDKIVDDSYYFVRNETQLMKASVATGIATQLLDFTTLGLGITNVGTGGTGDLSNDNWFACYSKSPGSKLAIVVNLNNLHLYTANYKIPRNGITALDIDPTPPNGEVFISRGVDSVSNKRYAIVVSQPFVFYSLSPTDIATTSACGSFQCGSLTFEQISPEYPKNIRISNLGNDDDICDPAENTRGECPAPQHNDMFQDKTGQQYLVTPNDFETTALGSYRGIQYWRLNAGGLMLRSAATEGGGRTDLPVQWSQAIAGDQFLDSHIGCGGGGNAAPYCVVSTYPDPSRTPGDLASAYTHKAHWDTATILKGVGEEMRTLVYGRSIVWGGLSVAVQGVSNTAPIVITTTVANPVLEGMAVCLHGTGVSAVNVETVGRCWTAHFLTSTTFSLNGTSASGSAGAGGTVSATYPEEYWPHFFASISNDGSRIIYNTNFGYYTNDGNENVVTALTGFTSGGSLTLTPGSLPATTVGASYSQSISGWASGGTAPYTWALAPGSTAMPGGVTISSTGLISGLVAGAAGTFTPTVRLSDSAGAHVDQQTSIAVNAAPSIQNATPLSGAIVAILYSLQLTATGGTSPLTWDIASGLLPPGFSLSSGGMLGGTPSQTGTFNFTVRVTDASSITGSKSYQLTVAPGSSASIGISGAVRVSGKTTVK